MEEVQQLRGDIFEDNLDEKYKIDVNKFFKRDWTDYQLEKSSKYKQMLKEPSFIQIYDNIEYLIDQIDENDILRRKVQKDEGNKNKK